MSLQNTIRDSIELRGIECYGGCEVKATLMPAPCDTGIVFKTKEGEIKASIRYAYSSKRSVLLGNENVQVLHVEHLLATLYAYQVDNAVVEVERIPSKSFERIYMIGWATEAQVIPKFDNGERTLCERLDEIGLQQQDKERRIFRIKEYIDKGKLSFEPIQSGIVISATTDYKIPGIQTKEIAITPKVYRNELSQSRPYANVVPVWMPRPIVNVLASYAFPSFGIGHGYSSSNVFLPVKSEKEWKNQELYDAEIGRHTIVDRLGALALLERRLEGIKVNAKFSSHANDLKVLKRMVKEGVFVPSIDF